MLRLNLPSTSTSAPAQTYPNRLLYEETSGQDAEDETITEGVDDWDEQLDREEAARREKRQRRVEEAVERAKTSASNRTDGNAACVRQCGTSCGSVIWQSSCACLAIAASFWIGFVVLGWLEIIGISKLPPGMEHGHKVKDFYR